MVKEANQVLYLRNNNRFTDCVKTLSWHIAYLGVWVNARARACVCE